MPRCAVPLQQQAGAPGCGEPLAACEGGLGGAGEQLSLRVCQNRLSACYLTREKLHPQFPWTDKRRDRFQPEEV